MARIVSGILGAVAATLALSAAHLEVASGHDALPPGLHNGDAMLRVSPSPVEVNRDAKADRDTLASNPREPLRTVSINVDRLANTSVLVRIPADVPQPGKGAESQPEVRPLKPAGQRKMVACEGVVSVLTDVAKVLGPARCIT